MAKTASKPSNKKINDVTAPKKSSKTPASSNDADGQLHVSGRSFMGGNQPSDDAATETAPDLPLSTKRKVITPLSPHEDMDGQESDDASAGQNPAPITEASEASAKTPEAALATDEPAPADASASDSTSATDASVAASSSAAETEAEPPAASGSSPMNREKTTEEAEKFAEEEAKRQQELQAYIDNRKYNVPIGAVAQRRSVIISILLTIIVLLLAIVLVDLMLDSGIILLLTKLPHTHFFSLGG